MNRKIILEIIQATLTAALVGLILLQSRGTGLSATFGGTGFATSRRGVERIVFLGTIMTLILLSLSSVAITLLGS